MSVAVKMTLGPKDWLPGMNALRMPLPPKDERRLAGLKAKAKAGKAVKAMDALWLCGVAESLSRISLFEFDFPDYAGVINYKRAEAFAVRFERRPLIHQMRTLEAGETPRVLLQYRVELPGTDTLFVVRPWILPARDTDMKVFGEFRTWCARMEIDGEKVFAHDSVEEHSADPEGIPLRRLPYVLPERQRIWGAALLDGKTDPPQVKTDQRFGYCLPGGSHIRFSVSPHVRLSRRMSVRTGLVAAVYTTRRRVL